MFMKLDKSCTIEQKSSNNGFDISYSTPASCACNYQVVTEIDTNKTLSVVSGWVMLPGNAIVSEDSRITLDNGATSPIVSIKTITNFRNGNIEGIRLNLGKVLRGGSL